MSKRTFQQANGSGLPLIIAVSGKIGCGKDYTTENFLIPTLEQYGIKNCSRMAFADHIKINVASQRGIPIEECLVSQKSPELRRALQIVGTEQGRDLHGPEIWVQTLENWIRLRAIREESLGAVMVTDCRFPNEAAWVEKNGGLLIRVNAPSRNALGLDQACLGDTDVRASVANHRSETALDNYEFKHVVQNEPGDDAEKNIKEIVEQYFSSFKDTPAKKRKTTN